MSTAGEAGVGMAQAICLCGDMAQRACVWRTERRARWSHGLKKVGGVAAGPAKASAGIRQDVARRPSDGHERLKQRAGRAKLPGT